MWSDLFDFIIILVWLKFINYSAWVDKRHKWYKSVMYTYTYMYTYGYIYVYITLTLRWLLFLFYFYPLLVLTLGLFNYGINTYFRPI